VNTPDTRAIQPRSMATWLPGVMVAGLLVAACAADALWGWRHAMRLANTTVDGPMRSVIQAIDVSLSAHGNDLTAPAMQQTLDSLQNAAGHRLHIRVARDDGQHLFGAASSFWPRSNAPLTDGVVTLQDAQLSAQSVRLGSLVRPLGLISVHPSPPVQVLIQVAVDATERDALAKQLLAEGLLRDLGLALLAGLLSWGALKWLLRPLARLNATLAMRPRDDLSPLPTQSLPGEVQPLMEGVNHHMARVQHLIDTQRRFMDDTAHQLRAPLTTLQTQVSCALREPDPTLLRKALDAIHCQLDDAVRQTQQMLTLARTDDADFVLLPTDIHAVAAACARDWWRTARAHGVMLSFEAEHAPPMLARGHAGLIKEALANLLHNAVRHASAGGHISVGLKFGDGSGGSVVYLSVTDDGTGIPDGELPRLGERYYRASNSQGSGSGLGLSIVRAIVERHDGQLHFGVGHEGRGLAVTLQLPAAQSTPLIR
jgi:two-component system sensor histidine kinase TctE